MCLHFSIPHVSLLFLLHSAVELGTDMLELDCHLTKDEQVVVLHDFNLKRLTGVSCDISDVAYAVSGRDQSCIYTWLHVNRFLLMVKTAI